MLKITACIKSIILLFIILSIVSCKRIFDPVTTVPKIAYRSFTDPYRNIIIMDIDGSNKKNITNDNFNRIVEFQWFPDGEKIVFEYLGDQSLCLGIVDINGNILFTSEENFINDATAPCVSPDGNNIAFVNDFDSGDIVVLNISEMSYKNLTTNFGKGFRNPRFSPDGNTILFHSGNIYTINTDGSNNRKLNDEMGSHPQFFKSGIKIIFQRFLGWIYEDLYIMDTNGNNIVRLTNDIQSKADIAVTPDGEKIIYAYEPNESSYREIFKMNSDGSNQVCLTDTLGGFDPDISPNGKKIVFTAYKNKSVYLSDVFIMNINGNNRKNLTSNNSDNDELPKFQPINIY